MHLSWSPVGPLGIALAAIACGRPTSSASDEPVTSSGRRVLRVCADPNSLPFSNQREEGFENRIAELLAREVEADLEYVWRAHRRGFLREGVNAGACDVVIGIATDIDMALTSRAYYRSSYVFVHEATVPRITSLDDPALRGHRIGVQLVGDDYANTPPVHALTRRGLAMNLRGFTVYGDYAEDSPPADVIRAVQQGQVDVAIAWGPLAGYFATRGQPPLVVHPVPAADPDLPMQYGISLAVKRGRVALLAELQAVLDAQRSAIDAILDAYGVPRV
jgi:mxaJ protein